MIVLKRKKRHVCGRNRSEPVKFGTLLLIIDFYLTFFRLLDHLVTWARAAEAAAAAAKPGITGAAATGSRNCTHIRRRAHESFLILQLK